MVTILCEVFDMEIGQALDMVITTVSVCGVLALLAWAGFRLGTKITNRGVGK